MQISLPVYIIKRYLFEYINTIVCYLYLDKANSINDIKQFYL